MGAKTHKMFDGHMGFHVEYSRELLWNTAFYMVIPQSILHKIPWSLHGKLCVLPPWNSTGYKTRTCILQDRPHKTHPYVDCSTGSLTATLKF